LNVTNIKWREMDITQRYINYRDII
jgi:hypothetical protein